MKANDRQRRLQAAGQLTAFEFVLYLAMVAAATFVQVYLHSSKSLPETLAWVIVYSFLLAVLFFGWARSNTGNTGQPDK